MATVFVVVVVVVFNVIYKVLEWDPERHFRLRK